jgi:hypothetical protein
LAHELTYVVKHEAKGKVSPLAPKLNCYLLSVPFSIVIVYMIERQLFMILFSSFWTVDREKNEIFYIDSSEARKQYHE